MSNFKIGDDVVCINNKWTNLIENKIYKVINISGHGGLDVLVENPKSERTIYYTVDRFMHLSDYRNEKLKKLGI